MESLIYKCNKKKYEKIGRNFLGLIFELIMSISAHGFSSE